MYTADALAEPMGILAPPESIRAGRSRTWSCSDLPQFTQDGPRSAAPPFPLLTRTFAGGTRIAQAVHESVPRALYRWHSTLSPFPAQASTRASAWNPKAVSRRRSTSSGPLPSAIHAESCVCLASRTLAARACVTPASRSASRSLCPSSVVNAPRTGRGAKVLYTRTGPGAQCRGSARPSSDHPRSCDPRHEIHRLNTQQEFPGKREKHSRGALE